MAYPRPGCSVVQDCYRISGPPTSRVSHDLLEEDGRWEKLAEIDMSLIEDEEDHIRFNHKAIGTGQDQTKAWADVEVGVEGEEARHERITAEHLNGCDGAGSAVRKSLFGPHWPGVTFDCRLMVQNIRYDGFEKHGWAGGNYMVDRYHWGLVARRGHEGLWRVTYGDPVPGLTDEEYLERRAWHLKAHAAWPFGSGPIFHRDEQPVQHTQSMRRLIQGRADPSRSRRCAPCLDVGGLADCFIGLFEGLAGEEILETYARVMRDIFLRSVAARSIMNLDWVSRSDPWMVAETDPFFCIIRELNKNPAEMKKFLMKANSIEYDFTQHYHNPLEDRSTANGVLTETANGVEGAGVKWLCIWRLRELRAKAFVVASAVRIL
ncbi:hypothetical protein LTR53_005197 [Teratosphaeriaceae sp. CCFEE 6253]|nr:hypothetical protein LTR53_005197 [Teratosphaeriaceae sp. CCFEE 6253]